MDPETAAGEPPEKCAKNIIRAMLRGDNELTPFKYLFAIWLRVTCPWLFFRAMEIRAKNLAPRYRNTQFI